MNTTDAASGMNSTTPRVTTTIGVDMVNPIVPGPLKEKLGTGGFGIVYKDPRNPAQRCVKQYKTPVIGEEADRLMRFAAVDQWARPSDAELMKSTFAWPLEVFGEIGRIQAFTMDTAPQDAHFELRMKNGNKYPRLLQLDYLIDATYFNSNAIDSSSAVVFSLQDRIELAINICESILSLHRYGLVYQDVSSKNIVARRGTPRSCFILDADSITTPEGAIAKPIKSPTWEVPLGLDPYCIDRARLALMVLRLIVQGHSVRPDVGCLELERRGYFKLSNAVKTTFETGEKLSAEQMCMELRLLRDPEHAQDAFSRAVQSRNARHIVREGISVTSVNDLNIVVNERLHLDREESIENAEIQEQRKLLQVMRNQNSFTVDVSANVGIMPIPRTAQELHELAFDSYFADVAQHLVRSGLPSLMNDPLMGSIADRAVVEAERGVISAQTSPGRGILQIEWPSTDFINAAEIVLSVGGVQQSIESVKRAPAELKMEREIRAKSGGSVLAQVRFGITTLQGDVLFQHFIALETKITIEAIPEPASRITRSGAIPMIDLFDPIEEARLLEVARIEKRKKRIKQILIGTILTVIGFAGGFIYLQQRTDHIHYQTPRDFESSRASAFAKTTLSRYQTPRDFESPRTSGKSKTATTNSTSTIATSAPSTTTNK
jgi:hypothetical protein